MTEEAAAASGAFYTYISSKSEMARAVFVEDLIAIADNAIPTGPLLPTSRQLFA